MPFLTKRDSLRSTPCPAIGGAATLRCAQSVFCGVRAAAKKRIGFFQGSRAANSVRLFDRLRHGGNSAVSVFLPCEGRLAGKSGLSMPPAGYFSRTGKAPKSAPEIGWFRGSVPIGGREVAGNRLTRRCIFLFSRQAGFSVGWCLSLVSSLRWRRCRLRSEM